MIGQASLLPRPLTTAAVFALLFMSSACGRPCCSHDHRTCVSWAGRTRAECRQASDGTLVWLPGGEETRTCIERWTSTTCTIHADCCGTLVCEGLPWNSRVRQCQHPLEACASYTSDRTMCNSKSSCVFKGRKCVPNFDYTIRNVTKLPKDIPVDPACCSQDYRTCPDWTPATSEDCAADGGNYVWLPEGPISTACIERWRDDACTVHEDCCGTLVCDGMFWNIADKKCYHPLDLCATFSEESFCATRSSCKWEDSQCVPNFDWKVYLPANKPTT